MIAVVIPIRDDLDNNELQQKLISAVKALKSIPDDISEFYEQTCSEIPEKLRTVKSDLIEAINEFFQWRYGRQATNFSYKGETFYITGGLSWGGSPTDAFDVFVKFGAMPIEILRITGAKMFTGVEK